MNSQWFLQFFSANNGYLRQWEFIGSLYQYLSTIKTHPFNVTLVNLQNYNEEIFQQRKRNKWNVYRTIGHEVNKIYVCTTGISIATRTKIITFDNHSVFCMYNFLYIKFPWIILFLDLDRASLVQIIGETVHYTKKNYQPRKYPYCNPIWKRRKLKHRD